MREKSEHFTINKEKDFLKGFGGKCFEDGIVIDEYYISQIFDSRVKGMRWYKLAVQYSVPDNSVLEITFYSCDEESIEFEGNVYDIKKLLKSNKSLEEKKCVLEAIKGEQTLISEEILITRLTGRFLFFIVQSMVYQLRYPEIYKMKLYFKPYMWTNFLPEIYRSEEDSFLERYLAVFQSIYEDMEEKIENNAQNYSAKNASYEFLKWLSSWYCTSQPQLWNEEQLRYLVENAAQIYKNIGTKKIIQELTQLYLGEKVEVIEYYQNDKDEIAKKYNIPKEKLFVDPFVFTVVINSSAITSAAYENLKKIIDSCKPAHMQANILIINENLQNEYSIGDDIKLCETGCENPKDRAILT